MSSSPSSPSNPPSRKRQSVPPSSSQQSSISSFFRKARPSTGQGGEEATAAPPAEAEAEAEAVATKQPPRKRARTEKEQDGIDRNTQMVTAPTPGPPRKDKHEKAINIKERFAFSRQPASEATAGADANTQPSAQDRQDEEESEAQRAHKIARHRAFVRRLGGPDCLPDLINDGGGAMNDDAAVAESEEDREDDGPAHAAPSRKGSRAAGGKAAASKLTPMERQVIDIKKKHTDTILIVEVGYKFRFFGEDARVAAKELSIVCIPGKLRFDEHPSEAHLSRFASASIPVHRLHVHVKRLVQAGHKVGIVRQIETAALKAAGENRNAPFVRKLTNLYTKGTYIDDIDGDMDTQAAGAQGDRSPNTGFLLCITETLSAKDSGSVGSDEKVQVGMIAVQPATGDIVYDEFTDGFMRTEFETRLLHIAPCELLVVGDLSRATEKLVRHLSGSKVNVFGDRVRVERAAKSATAATEAHSHISTFYADLMKARSMTEDQRAANLLDKVLHLPDTIAICLSAMVQHMSEYGLEHVFDLTKYFQPFLARSYMLLNGNTLTNLEIYQNQTDHTVKGSLFWSLDRTRTRFGQRLLRRWVGRPLLNRQEMEERVSAVEELLNPQRSHLVERLRTLISRVKTDLEKSLVRIYYGKCSRSELLNVLRTLHTISESFAHVKGPADAGFESSILCEKIAALPGIRDIVVSFLEKINATAAKDDDKYNFFLESEEGDEISESRLGIAGVEYELEEHRTAIAEKLKKKKINYTTVAGIEYLVEVENSPYNLNQVPASWRKISGTRKVSRFHTPEVVQFMRERDQHKEALAAACDHAYMQFLTQISSHYPLLRDCVAALATIDALFSLSIIASQPGYVKPTYTDDARIDVKGGRHPMVEQLLAQSYVPNDTNLAADQTRGLLVTGPNMGGKSSYVRQIALIAIMGQIGSYVPAEAATLGMLDAVYTRMGAFDSIFRGQSTFMVELSETSDILRQATPRSLVILDELGRGTSTHDGVAIAQAVLEYVVREIRCLTLFITHYQDLSVLQQRVFPNGELKNVHMRFEETKRFNSSRSGADDTEITLLYQVGEGTAPQSYGLNVARLANVSDDILRVAAKQSKALEAEVHRRRFTAMLRGVQGLLQGQDGNVREGESRGESADDLLESIVSDLRI